MILLGVRPVVATLLLLALTPRAISQERLEDLRTAGIAGVLQVDAPLEPTAFTSDDSTPPAYTLAVPKADEPIKLERIDVSDAHQRKPSVKRAHLAYELVLTNISPAPLLLRRVEIADGNRPNAKPIAAYEGTELEAVLAFPGREQADGSAPRLQLKPTQSVAVNLFLSFEDHKSVPTTLRHHVYTTDNVVETSSIGTHQSKIPVLGPPLRGGNWLVMGGPGAKGITDYHRRNTLMLNGAPEAARRYAIDWVKVENGEMRSGEIAGNPSYYGYGQEILAVADGIITDAVDGIPENAPGHVPALALETPVCQICGNHVVLKLAQGQFATYMHLQPRSLRVATGDRVRRGQVLGRVGNSGDSYLPHLHFHVATKPGITGQGLPYLLERFTILDMKGAAQTHTRELPLDGRVIDFGT